MTPFEIDYKKLIEPLSDVCRAILINAGLKDSNLIKDFKVVVSAGSVTISFPDYAKFVDSGRRPGKMPPFGVISRWIRRKGLQIPQGYSADSFAFVIARSISINGIKPKPFLAQLADNIKELVVDFTRKEVLRTAKLLGKK